MAQVVETFEKKAKPALVSMHFQECTCCNESYSPLGVGLAAQLD